jgi:hypothetical protein
MNTDAGHDKARSKADDLAERKARLMRQGEFHRVSILHAKAQVKQAARPQALLHDAIDHATWAIRSRMDSLLKPTGVNLTSLAPYALTILGFIRRRRLGKPALAVAVVLAGLGWFLQRRRTEQITHRR